MPRRLVRSDRASSSSSPERRRRDGTLASSPANDRRNTVNDPAFEFHPEALLEAWEVAGWYAVQSYLTTKLTSCGL